MLKQQTASSCANLNCGDVKVAINIHIERRPHLAPKLPHGRWTQALVEESFDELHFTWASELFRHLLNGMPQLPGVVLAYLPVLQYRHVGRLFRQPCKTVTQRCKDNVLLSI
jgi:hypothetical protein